MEESLYYRNVIWYSASSHEKEHGLLGKQPKEKKKRVQRADDGGSMRRKLTLIAGRQGRKNKGPKGKTSKKHFNTITPAQTHIQSYLRSRSAEKKCKSRSRTGGKEAIVKKKGTGMGDGKIKTRTRRPVPRCGCRDLLLPIKERRTHSTKGQCAVTGV